MLSLGEHPCWSDWSDVFLSKGGSKDDAKKDESSDEYKYSNMDLTRFNTMVTCADKIQQPTVIALDPDPPEE